MAPRTLDPRPRAELGAAVPPGAVVIAVTDAGIDERYQPVRAAAATIASRAGGRVVLFHAPPGPLVAGGRPRLFEPPDVVAGSAVRPHTGSRRADLLLDEAAAIRATGADVAVWLARTSGPGAISDAVAATGAVLVLLPAERTRSCAGSLRIDRTLAYFATRIPVPILAVEPTGRSRPVLPLGRDLVTSARRLLTTGSAAPRDVPALPGAAR